MNHLLLGAADKTERLLEITKPRFLLIDDGPIADAFLERFAKARLFDPTVHSFNPLAGMDYRRAQDFADILYSASSGGKDTLTVRNGRRALVRRRLSGPSRLSDMPEPSAVKDDAEVAKLDRAKLGDFDAFILGALLMGQHKGQIVAPDFGFYGRPLHAALVRENRLTASLRFLEEVPRQLSQALLTIPHKYGRGCTFEDAEALARYEELAPGTNAHADFVQRRMEQ